MNADVELILRGATVVDGTGDPSRPADVGIVGDRIAAVDEPGALRGAETIDLDGLVLAPGFVDVHTHYDAQVLWDQDLTPSSWHGVTTVVMGNCGFGVAPTRAEHRETIARTLENVEGMSMEALVAGIPWTFETFPQYLDALDAAPARANVAAFIGHTPLRLYVLGEESTERAATAEEVARMRHIVVEAMAAGALGFATSQSPTHSGAWGRPVPSRLATKEEIFSIASAVGDAGRGIVQVTPGPGFFLDELSQLSVSLSRPVTWTALLTRPGHHGQALALAEQGAALPGEVWPQVACLPLSQVFQLIDPFPLSSVPAFADVLGVTRDRRAEVYADPSWRERAGREVGGGARSAGARLARVLDQTWVAESARHRELVGQTLSAIALQRGESPFDVMVELSLEEELTTRFYSVFANDDEEEIAELLRDRRTVLGLSDAGAHASQICDARFATHLLGHWVRERGALSLEEAVWRLSGQAAEVFGIARRGRIVEGWAADLVAFDPDRVGDEPPERVWDLPGGADRLVSRSSGIEHVWVNGAPTRTDGKDLDRARPGRLLRAGSA
ncbi:MAG: N-acyl-D-amino-acid deacylase family protein [Acidimicrobiales bacterium]